MELGNLVVSVQFMAEGLEAGAASAAESLEVLKSMAEKLDHVVENTGKKAGETGERAAASYGMIAAAAAAAFASITKGVSEGIEAYNKYQGAVMGLQSIAENANIDKGALGESLKGLTDKFMDAGAASTALKNLLSRGYSLDQAVNTINRLKDAAAFGRQAGYGFAEAVVSAIPLWSKTLPTNVLLDETKKKNKDMPIINPFTITKGSDNEVIKELRRLTDATGVTDFLPSGGLHGSKFKYTGMNREIDPHERETYNEQYSELIMRGGVLNGVEYTGLADIIGKDEYKALSDSDKVRTLKETVEAREKALRNNLIAQNSDAKVSVSVEKEELTQKYAVPAFLTNSTNKKIKWLNDKHRNIVLPLAMNREFSVDKVKYKFDDIHADEVYREYEERLIATVSANMPTQSVEKAVREAMNQTKKWYAKKYGK